MNFIFWRLAYNVGLGYVLWKQSHTKFLTKWFAARGKNVPTWLKRVLASSMADDYDFDVG